MLLSIPKFVFLQKLFPERKPALVRPCFAVLHVSVYVHIIFMHGALYINEITLLIFIVSKFIATTLLPNKLGP
jgi:hypothetical protein